MKEEVARIEDGQAEDFLSFMLSASTQEIRGLGCSHAERAQLAAWLATSEERQAKVLHAYRLIEGAYICYDTPKKFPMKVVRRVLARLLSDARLAPNSAKMTDYIKANYFQRRSPCGPQAAVGMLEKQASASSCAWKDLVASHRPPTQRRCWRTNPEASHTGAAEGSRHASNTERLRRAGRVRRTQAELEAAGDPAAMAQGRAP